MTIQPYSDATMVTAAPLEGQLIDGRYAVLSLEHESDCAHVYRAKRMTDSVEVALKVFRRGTHPSRAALDRFNTTGERLKSLEHPGVTRVFDYGMTEMGRPYLVMEWLDGLTAERVMDSEGTLDIDTVLLVGTLSLQALTALHQIGVFHGNMCPSNLLISDGKVKLVGLSMDRDEATYLAHGVTPKPVWHDAAYFAPERSENRHVDAKVDVYALGMTLFDMVAGGASKRGYAMLDGNYRNSDGELPAPRGLLTSKLGPVITRATKHAPEERYRTADDMLREIAGDAITEATYIGVAPRLSGPFRAVAERLERFTTKSLPAATRRGASAAYHAAKGLLQRMQTEYAERGPIKRPDVRTALLGVLVAAVAILGILVITDDRGADPGDSALAEIAPIPAIQPTAPVVAESPAREELQPVTAERVRLRAYSSPSRAAVSLEGESVCTTPCNARLETNDGPVQIVIEREGYVTHTETVTLSDDVFITVVLQRVEVAGITD